MNVGESRVFNYTGGIQTFNIDEKGLYSLEVYGAQGQTRVGSNLGGRGGYSKGYIVLDSGLLYIVVGGQDGYNGGGTYRDQSGSQGGRGGGATHMAYVTGLLHDIGKASFVDNGTGLIVAGGGGGGYYSPDIQYNGGAGGGLTGGNATSNVSTGIGGSQTQAGGQSADFGLGGHDLAGGGGGLYGGGVASWGAGAGGSGYIGGVPTITFRGVAYAPETTNGVNTGNGKAIITLIEKAGAPIFLGNTPVDAVYLGNTPVDAVALGNTPL